MAIITSIATTINRNANAEKLSSKTPGKQQFGEHKALLGDAS